MSNESQSDTPTPMTDAETFDIPIHGADGTGSRSAVVRYHFARTLERELTAAQARIAELESALGPLVEMYNDFTDRGEDITYENAYYTFYKGQYPAWRYAAGVLHDKNENLKDE